MFFVDNIHALLSFSSIEFASPALSIILPLGISFYTFQTLSYTIDVYRNHTKPIFDFALYGSYVTFFPQLVAGPILRVEEVSFQLNRRPKFSISDLSEGAKRIMYGFFLKVVLADNIAPLVDAGFDSSISSLTAIDVWTLAFLFGFQIYFDFAGYSHIAIGCAKAMGINFPENFNFPYAAKSFRDFWKKWHISLSSWIRDYLYLPLTGTKVLSNNSNSEGGIEIAKTRTKVSNYKKNKALFLTWTIMGFWHGANWTYILWGLYHSLMIYLERLLKPIRIQLPFFSHPFTGWCITIPLAMLGWIPFRAQSLSDALSMYVKIFKPYMYLTYSMRENVYIITFLIMLFVTIAFLVNNVQWENILPTSLLFIVNTIKFSILFILIYTFFRPVSQFIYFQF